MTFTVAYPIKLLLQNRPRYLIPSFIFITFSLPIVTIQPKTLMVINSLRNSHHVKNIEINILSYVLHEIYDYFINFVAIIDTNRIKQHYVWLNSYSQL